MRPRRRSAYAGDGTALRPPGGPPPPSGVNEVPFGTEPAAGQGSCSSSDPPAGQQVRQTRTTRSPASTYIVVCTWALGAPIVGTGGRHRSAGPRTPATEAVSRRPWMRRPLLRQARSVVAKAAAVHREDDAARTGEQRRDRPSAASDGMAQRCREEWGSYLVPILSESEAPGGRRCWEHDSRSVPAAMAAMVKAGRSADRVAPRDQAPPKTPQDRSHAREPKHASQKRELS
jgi:hypothetical protein